MRYLMPTKKTLYFCGIIIIFFLFIVAYNLYAITSDTPSNEIISKIEKYHNYDDYNENIIIVDYSKPSCEERFYIYNIKDKKYLYSGLCAHGNGLNSTASKPEFSNNIGSNCSSLGFFKITSKGKMNYRNRDCYRLEGLSESNSSAQKRGILIHPSTLVSSIPFEIKGVNLPLTNASQGCFAVSFYTMSKINEIYNGKPILIYAYYKPM